MIMEPSSNELSVHNVSSLLDNSTITEGERFGIICFGRHHVDISDKTKASWSDYDVLYNKHSTPEENHLESLRSQHQTAHSKPRLKVLKDKGFVLKSLAMSRGCD